MSESGRKCRKSAADWDWRHTILAQIVNPVARIPAGGGPPPPEIHRAAQRGLIGDSIPAETIGTLYAYLNEN